MGSWWRRRSRDAGAAVLYGGSKRVPRDIGQHSSTAACPFASRQQDPIDLQADIAAFLSLSSPQDRCRA